MRMSTHVLAPVASLLLAACGGGAGAPRGPVTVVLSVVPDLTGTLTQAGYLTPQALGVGDRSPPGSPTITFRAFMTFDLASIPPGATLLSAALTVHQTYVSGTPYASLGPLLLDQVVYGTVLEAGAYNRSFPTSQGVVISTDATLGPRTVLTTTQVAADLAAGRTLAQYRIRFTAETDTNGLSDQADIGSPTAAPSGQHPTLVITYE